MKFLSILLIIAYLMLPAFCFGSPCEFHYENAEYSCDVSDDADEYPANLDTDNCETTCCCAGHIPLTALTKISYPALTGKLLANESLLALPQILDRIFVPPQNLT